MSVVFVWAVSPEELMEKAGPSPASLRFLWMLTSLRLSLRRICVKRKQEPGRALAQGGVFLLVRLFSVRACAPFAKSEHKAFREKAPSEERSFAMVLLRRGLLGIKF